MTAQLVNNYNKFAAALSVNFPYSYRHNLLRLALLQFLLVFLFLYLFKPFGYDPDNHVFNYAITCLFQAFSPALIVYVYFLALNHFNQQTNHKWTIGMQLLHSALVLFLIGLASFFLRGLIYNKPDNLSWVNLVTELKNVYLAGSLFVTYVLVRNRKSPQKSSAASNYKDSIAIKTETKKDDFMLHSEHFVYAKAEGNYVDLYCEEQGLLKKDLKRISLKNLNIQLKNYSQFVRCHRAYLVNTRHIVKISGNAQGYLLSINGTSEKIPVSRTYLFLFESLLNDFKKN